MLTLMDKLRIVHSIPDEQTLRSDVLLPIFRQLPGVEQVFLTHGANEEGKDFVIVERDALNHRVYTAVIAKSQRLMRSTSPRLHSPSVVNVIAQLSLSLATGFDCPLAETHVQFHKLLFATNQEISNHVSAILTQEYQRHLNVACHNLSDRQLVDLIDKYLPYYYYVGQGAIADYLRALAARCDKFDEHAHIGIYHGAIRNVADLFVAPKLLRSAHNPTKNGPPLKTVTASPTSVLAQGANMLLISGPGGGKSTLLRATVQDYLALSRRGKGHRVPVLVRAHDIGIQLKAGATSLESAIQGVLTCDYGDAAIDLARMLEEKHVGVRLMIDAIDEIPDPTLRDEVCTVVARFASTYPSAQVIVTSRPADDNTFDRLSGKFVRWQLFWPADRLVARFASRWFRDKTDEERFLSTIRQHNLLDKLPSTPLVITLLAILFDYGQTDLPASLPELYSMFTDLLLGKWNLDRRVEMFYKENHVEYVLTRLGGKLHRERRTGCTREYFSQVVQEAAGSLGVTFDGAKMLQDLIETVCLLQEDNGLVEFRHLSFQEFYAAKDVAIDQADGDPHAYLAKAFSDAWLSPLAYYYAGLHNKDLRLLRHLREAMDVTDPVNLARMIWEMGYVLQAAYLTPASERVDAIVEQVIRYGQLLTRLIEDGDVLPEDVPTWLGVAIFARAFCTHYRSGLWASFENQMADVVRERTDPSTVAGLASRLLVALMLSDRDACGDALLALEPLARGVPMLYVALTSELAVLLADEDDPAKKAAASSLRRVEQEVRRWVHEHPETLRAAFMAKRTSRLATAAETRLKRLGVARSARIGTRP